MRFLRRSLVGLFLMSVTFALIAAAGGMVYRALETRWADEGGGFSQRERVFAVNVIPVEPGTVSPVITTFGEIDSRRVLELRAPAAGEIVWRSDHFEEGARVTAGEPLVRIDAADATGRRDSARADLAERDADLRDARRSLEISIDELKSLEGQAALRTRALDRQRNLLERGVGTEAAVEDAELAAQVSRQSVLSSRRALAQAEARLDQTLNALDRSRIALEEAERRLAETEILVPFDGTLGGVDATLGRLVTTNERLADLIDTDALEVAFRVSAGQYAQLARGGADFIGADVTVSLDVTGVDITATGRITRESPSVEDGQTGRLLFARLGDAPGFLPGDFVTVEITEPPLDRVAVLPSTAIDAAGRVLVLGEEDRLETAEVTLVRRQGDDVIVRARGLAGREVVAERTPFLGAGIGVRPIRPGADDAPAEPAMVELDEDRRAKLIAFVEASQRMPDRAKERVLAQLRADRVPADMVNRLESRMGG